MSYQWAANTEFREVTLEVTERTCPKCQHRRVIESRRKRRIFTCEGPVHLTCQLCRCSNPDCPDHKTLVSPEAEMRLVLPYCVLGWDVLCWLGHRRFARHWSVPQIRQELKDRFEIPLSEDAIEEYVFRYQRMVAAEQQDPDEFKKAYQGVKGLVLSIDGLQPEKGHETLYVVREIGQNRVWFAVALLSSTDAEVKRILVRAREMVEQLGLPVQSWVSDKQKAFVTGIAEVFKGVPHRYCENHCLRDLAKPMLVDDSNAKVHMRKKVRGLRKNEHKVEAEKAAAIAAATAAEAAAVEAAVAAAIAAEAATVEAVAVAATPVSAAVTGASVASEATAVAAAATLAEAVAAAAVAAETAAIAAAATSSADAVLDYCVAVRGILNDNKGGPLHPPGERMAEALIQVREAIRENPEAKKGGPQGRI